MSYLAEPTSKTEYGVVQIGDNIDVSEAGIISLLQDLGHTADVKFNSIDVEELTVGDANVVTSVTPTAGAGIGITNIQSSGYDVTFDVANTGVLSLTAGSGINLSAATGSITISSSGADFLNTTSANASYTASATDEYIGVTASGAVTITLPTGTTGRVYTIKDENGGSPKITVIGTGGQKLDNRNSYLIEVRYQSVSLMFRNGGWWII